MILLYFAWVGCMLEKDALLHTCISLLDGLALFTDTHLLGNIT